MARAAEVTVRGGGPTSLLLAAAERGWPDALAANVVGASQRAPVLLTRPGELPAVTAGVPGPGDGREVRLVGGPAALSDAVETAVRDGR